VEKSHLRRELDLHDHSSPRVDKKMWCNASISLIEIEKKLAVFCENSEPEQIINSKTKNESLANIKSLESDKVHQQFFCIRRHSFCSLSIESSVVMFFIFLTVVEDPLFIFECWVVSGWRYVRENKYVILKVNLFILKNLIENKF